VASMIFLSCKERLAQHTSSLARPVCRSKTLRSCYSDRISHRGRIHAHALLESALWLLDQTGPQSRPAVRPRLKRARPDICDGHALYKHTYMYISFVLYIYICMNEFVVPWRYIDSRSF
jgi:hypothetical protein